MHRIYSQHLQRDPAYFQKLANDEPVLIDMGEKKQLLIDYDEFVRLGGKLDIRKDKNFVSAYDSLMKIMSNYSEEELELLASDDIEFDKSMEKS